MKELNSIIDEIRDKTNFYGSEYVINNMEQICPFINLKLKRAINLMKFLKIF